MHGVTHAHDARAPRPGQASLLWSLSSSLSLSRDILFKTRRVRNINIGLARNLKMPSREGREDIATRDMCRHSAAMNALSMQTADRAGGE